MGAFKGKINWFDHKKKFGYVTDGYGNQYFYHASGINKGRQIVLQGFESEDEVEFDLVDGEKGKMATNLVLIKEAPKKKPKKKEEKAPQGKGVMAIAIEKAMKEKEEKEAAEAETSTTSETPTVEETPVTTEATTEPKAE